MSRRDRFKLVGLLHLAVTSVVLVFFVDAWPYWKDSGQLMAAYGTAGLPHPTGFPLVASFGRLASLLPLGSMAFRINLLSAGCAAITSTVLFLLAGWLMSNCGRGVHAPNRPVDGPPTMVLAWGGAWAFIATRTVWFHSVAAEVYLPSAVLSVSLIACAMRSLALGADPHRDRTLRLLALGTGLASGLHVTAFAAGAGSLALVVFGRGVHTPKSSVEAIRMCRLGGQLAFFLIAGLLIQWYLPIRAWTGPWTKFADPSDLGGWLGYMTGRTIRSAFHGEIGAGGSLTTLSENASMYGDQLIRQSGPALLLAVLGLLTLARRSPLAGLLAAVAWAGDLVFSVVINPMGQKDYQTGVLSLFMIFLLAALGLGRLLEILPERRIVRQAAAGLVAVALMVVPILSFPAANRALGASGLPYRYGLSILEVPPGSLVLTTLDDASGLLLYHQLLENRRRDCLNLVLQNLGVPSLVSAQAERYGESFFPPSVLAQEEGLSAREVAHSVVGHNLRAGNPVFWQSGQMHFHEVVRGHLEPGFPVGRVRIDVGPAPPDGRWAAVLDAWQVWRAADPIEPDPVGSMVLADALGLAGAMQVEEIQTEMSTVAPPSEALLATAEALFSESLRLYAEDCRIWSNYAVFKGLSGQVGFAAEAAERASVLCPQHPPSRANQVRYRILSGSPRGGLEVAAEIMELPNSAEIAPRLLRLADDLDRGGMGDVAASLRRILD